MASRNPSKSSSQNKSSPSSSSHRKSRWGSDNNPKTPADSKPSGSGAAASNPKSPLNPKSSNNPKIDDAQNSKAKSKTNANPNPSPAHLKPASDPSQSGAQFPFPDSLGPPPPPAYGFHMLERRTIVLADGSVRSYFALPPDYQDFAPPPRPLLPQRPELHGPDLGFDRRFPQGGPMGAEFRDREDPFMRGRNQDYWNSLGLDAGGGGPMHGQPDISLKRKFGDEREVGRIDEREARDGFERQRQQLLQYGNAGANSDGYPMGSGSYLGRGEDMRSAKHMRTGGDFRNLQANAGLKHNDVDQVALKKTFLHFIKLINDNANQKKNYLADGKQGSLQCVACGRSSKDFSDMHGLIMHTYNPGSADSYVDHLGLHKALCVLMGWNYLVPPDNSKAYQLLSADEAAANLDDLIMWPPVVIIHNTHTGKGRDGRMEGLGNKSVDAKLRDLGFSGGKAKSLYGREGHLGITLVKYAGDLSGLKEAVRVAEFFEKDNHGRKGWARIQSQTYGTDENNPNLVRVDEKTGETKRIFYGYLGTVSDLDDVDFETRKKISIESRREFKPSN